MSRNQWIVLAILVPVVLVGGIVIGRTLRPDSSAPSVQIASAADRTEFEHDYVIPSGTAQQISDGEAIEIVPSTLTVRVGDSIRIVNEDVTDHVVGIFFVRSGETLTQQFASPGELSGQCSVHAGGEFTVVVEA